MRKLALAFTALLLMAPVVPAFADVAQLEQQLVVEQSTPVFDGHLYCRFFPEKCGLPVPALTDPGP